MLRRIWTTDHRANEAAPPGKSGLTIALLRKEIHTQRVLVLGGLAVAALLPVSLIAGAMAGVRSTGMHELLAALMPLYALLVWPLFAAATAGNAFAADNGDGTLRFLLSRPISRTRVWMVKVGVALAAFVNIVVGTTLLGIGLLWLSAADNAAFQGTVRRQLVDSFDLGEVSILAVPFLLLFGCSIYCSMLAKRPLVATLGGFLVLGAMVGITGLVWSALMWSVLASRSSEVARTMFVVGAATGIALATVCVYAASFRVFRKGDIFGGTVPRRAWRPLLAITVAVLLIGPVPAAYAGMHWLGWMAAEHIGNLVVAGDGVVVPEPSPTGFTTALVRHPLGGGAPSVVVARDATSPTVSPDGDWVVFAGYASYLARLSRAPHLRAARIDGTEDHAISGPLPGWVWSYPIKTLLVAPDNDHVAFVASGDVLVTSISGGPGSSVELTVAESQGGARPSGVIGWKAGEPAELLYYRVAERFPRTPAPGGGVEWAGSMLETELLAFDPFTRESRLVRDFVGRHRLRVWGTNTGFFLVLPTRPWTWLPVWLDNDDDGEDLHLVDVAGGGEMIDLNASACGNWGLAAGGTRFVYASCSGGLRTGDAHAEVRLHDLVSGSDERFAELEGYELAASRSELFLSPDGSRILFYTRRGYDARRGTHVVSRGGTARMIAEGFVPLGWRNDAEAILARSRGLPFELRIVNVDTGQTRVILP